VCRNVFVGPLSSHDGGSKNGVCGCKTCGDGKRRKEVEAWDEGVYESSRDKPTLTEIGYLALSRRILVFKYTYPSHNRDQQEK